MTVTDHQINGRTDGEFELLAGVPDIEAVVEAIAGKRVLVVGAGDLVAKKEPFFAVLKRAGAKVYLGDSNPKPKALPVLEKYISEFVLLNGDKMPDLGFFDMLDISTWGFTHLPMALRFWDRAEVIVTTKPVDTNLELLRAMRTSALFKPLRERLVVHDHYGGRWVLCEAAARMPLWHSVEGFVRTIQIYILERKTVNDEMDRIDALRDGVCLDLMPHAIRVLQALLPIGSTWMQGDLRYTRKALKLSVEGGAREHNVGCPIEGTVETFAAVNILGEDVVQIGTAEARSFPFECLIVVGKGLVANGGDVRDTKGVSVLFETGNRLNIDLETQRAQTPGGALILPPEGVLHRGINLPLIELAKAGFPRVPPPLVNALYQTFDQAVDAAELIDRTRRLDWLGRAYSPRFSVVSMINLIPRNLWGGRGGTRNGWQLDQMPRISIGDIPKDTLVVS
jgi:hypothetical protein